MPQCLTTISQSDEILILPLASNRSPPPPQRITGPVVENQFEDGDASADGNQREICFCHFFHMEVRPSAYSDEAGISHDDLGMLSVLVTVMVKVVVVVMVMMVMVVMRTMPVLITGTIRLRDEADG